MGNANDPRKGSPSAGSYAHLNRITDPATRDALKYLTDHVIQLRQDHDNHVGYVDKPLLTHLNANDNQLKGLQDPADPQDAVTLTYLQTYVANYATAQGGTGTTTGGSTTPPSSGGGSAQAVAPNYASAVGTVWSVLGINSSSTPFQLFKFVQAVVWLIHGAQPLGETLVGLLTQTGGDGVYTCNGVTYACFRLCFDNGANIKILTGSFQPQWTQEANIDVADWHAPTDPATDCP